MFETLLLLLLIGFLLSLIKTKNIADPFLIYFTIWGAVFLSIYLDQDSYIRFSDDFLTILITVKLLSIIFSVISLDFFKFRVKIISNKNADPVLEVRTQLLDLALFIGIICLPFVYFRALHLSDNIDVFSLLGYVALRRSMTDELLGYGICSYVMLMTYVATSIRFLLYLQTKKNILGILLSILLSLLYVYFSTGRTFVVLFFSMLTVPGIVLGKLRARGIFLFLFVVISIFILIAAMTSKGISFEIGLTENILSTFENIRSYVTAPILACNVLFNTFSNYEFGRNTFRTVFVLLNTICFGDFQIVELIKEYVEVPWPTNVYTVYEVYYKDFSIIGFYIPSIFLLLHLWLYKKANTIHGKWLFFYAASFYPLVMQFFQDQYFSLFSMYLQIVFWCILFFKSSRWRSYD